MGNEWYKAYSAVCEHAILDEKELKGRFLKCKKKYNNQFKEYFELWEVCLTINSAPDKFMWLKFKPKDILIDFLVLVKVMIVSFYFRKIFKDGDYSDFFKS